MNQVSITDPFIFSTDITPSHVAKLSMIRLETGQIKVMFEEVIKRDEYH